MKKFRIVTDAFSGYEAQLKYAFFPFKWFQLNDYLGVNTWDTAEQAMEFIQQKKAGVYVKTKAHEFDLWGDCQQEVKRLLGFAKINRGQVIWQEKTNETALPSISSCILQPAY